MYIAICDDQVSQIEILTKLLNRYQQERKTTLRFKIFQSAYELLEAAQKERFTLYLLDVMMPGIDGLAAAREIRNTDNDSPIVFLTSSPNFAYESYSVHAFDYLLKPITEDTLFGVLDKLVVEKEKAHECLTLKCGTSLVRVPFSQLVYVEINGKHLYFSLTDNTEHKVFGTLKDYANTLLSRPEFMQIHRSYIVNMYQVAELFPNNVKTFTEKNLPVSRLTYPKLQKDYMNLLFARRED